MTKGADIELDHLLYVYETQKFHFHTHLKANSITAILGESGAGKSTLIQLIAGFLSPISGQIRINQKNITHCSPSQRPLSILFQDHNLFSHLTSFENITLACQNPLKPTEQEKIKIKHLLQKTNLTGKENRLPNMLSGGEKQRVAIVRSLMREQPILIMDEPFSALGPGLRQELLELIVELKKTTQFTLLFATHAPQDILFLNGDILFIHQEKIFAHGKAKDLLSTKAPIEIQKYAGLNMNSPRS